MGIISDSGSEFYEVIKLEEAIEPWVKEHVVPFLGKEGISFAEFRSRLHDYLAQFKNPTVVVDWYTDAVHFFEAFQGRDHSESLEYPCVLQLVSLDDLGSDIPHNALSDAKAIRRLYSEYNS